MQVQDGPDIIQQLDNWGDLFADNLVDISDVAEKLDGSLDGTWRTVPWTIVESDEKLLSLSTRLFSCPSACGC